MKKTGEGGRGAGGAGGGQLGLPEKRTPTAQTVDSVILLSTASVARSASGDFWPQECPPGAYLTIGAGLQPQPRREVPPSVSHLCDDGVAPDDLQKPSCLQQHFDIRLGNERACSKVSLPCVHLASKYLTNIKCARHGPRRGEAG